MWRPFVNNVYPSLLRTVNHDYLHRVFLWASALRLVPKASEEYVPQNNKFFKGSVGVQAGLLKERAEGMQSIIDMGNFAFVELGPSTIDCQYQPSFKTKLLEINASDNTVSNKYEHSRFSCNQVVHYIIAEQTRIRDTINKGKLDQLSPAYKNAKIGV